LPEKPSRKCYYCDKSLAKQREMSESALTLAGHDFGLGAIEVPPERCPHCGSSQPASPLRGRQQPETD
jgi:hypothetical protein